MRMKWRNLMIVLLVLMGIGFIVYPRYQVYRIQAEQEDMMATWQQALTYIDIPPLEEAVEDQQTDPVSLTSGDNTTATVQEGIEETIVDMEGIMTIPSINLELPILKGVTERHLNRALAAMDNGFTPGSGMNFVVAGHRSHRVGQLFNRLDEVVLDDSITINFGSVQESFVVTEKLYVKPDDLSVLTNQYEEDELTLITCHPMIHPTHRLIVKARLE